MSNSEMSYDTRLLITILLLIFVYPVGVFFMYRWMKWHGIIKGIIALPIALLIIVLFGGIIAGITSTVNPSAQLEKAQQQSVQSK